MIVLSSPKTVKDLMQTRSAIYSSRPSMYLAHDVAGNGHRFVTMVSFLFEIGERRHTDRYSNMDLCGG